MLVQSLSEACHQRCRARCGVDRAAHRAQAADHDLERRLHLRAPRRLREKFLAGDDRAQHGAQVAVAAPEGLGCPLHQRRGRRVTHETLRQLERDVTRGGGMLRQQVQQALTFGFTLSGRKCRAHHLLGARIVQRAVEVVLRQFVRLPDAPAGQDARCLGHVALRVAAIHSQGVQLHQFARVVLVQPAPTLLQAHQQRVALRWRHSGQLRRALHISPLHGAHQPR